MAASPAVPESKDEDASNDEPESEDLKKFRQEWLEEVQARKDENVLTSKQTSDAGSSASIEQHAEGPPNVTESRNVVTNANRSKGPRSVIGHHTLVGNSEIGGSSSLRKALDIYRRAVSHEQSGELDEALTLYRQAFRLDDKVDRAYRCVLLLESRQQGGVMSYVEGRPVTLQRPVFVNPPNTTSIPKESLLKVIWAFPRDLKFEPENEDEPILLNKLPEELLVFIISYLDPASVESFATLSRKARLVSLDAGIWRVLVFATYRPPQLPSHDVLLAVLESYHFDYRRVFIEQPRIRLDGVYIAICHYVRPGLGENHWVNVSHLIIYHRYLRFFPNGQVLSLLANEEKTPREIIPSLKPNLRMKGLLFGHWKLNGTTVHLSGLADASGRFEAAHSVINHVYSDDRGLSHGDSNSSNTHRRGHGSITSSQTDTLRYTFEMTLNLRSKPLGKWNRMNILTYDSVNLESGDVHPVALKHERPFWFSKVRSYT